MLNKRRTGSGVHLKWGICCRARWIQKRGCWGGRDHKESTWWSLYFMPMFVIIVCFLRYHMYVFFYNKRNVWTNLERKLSECMNVKGTERKVLTECFSPILFFYCSKTVNYPPLSKDSLMHHFQCSCWGSNCAIKMTDRYCYQSFFKELFIHIITTFIITVLQMLSTLLSIWGIIAVCCT